MSESVYRIPDPAKHQVVAANVTKSFGNLQVLKGIDLTVDKGEVVTLLGPSGSGKTTFLRLINQMERLDGGRIWVDGELVGVEERNGKLHERTDADIARQRSKIGMVFQRFNLFPHKTAIENVTEAPRIVKKMPADKARTRPWNCLPGWSCRQGGHYPSQLSGGQQQRVAIASLAMEPTDAVRRATSALDPELVGEVLAVMRAAGHQGWR